MKFSLGNWLVEKVGKWLTKNKPPQRAYLCDFDRIRYEVRPCDVLLIEGRNHVSNIIKKITQSPWSHSMMYIGRLHDVDDPKLRQQIRRFYHGPPDQQLLIESVLGKGTIITPIEHYRHDHIRICRPQGLSRADAQKVIAFAIGRLGAKYNVRHILDLMRFMFPWSILPRHWRSSLFEHNALQPTHDICSSMLADAFASVKFPILPIIKHDGDSGIELIQRYTQLYTPSDFDYSPYFNIIKYPYFSIADHGPYKDLPWREGAVAYHDKEKVVMMKESDTQSIRVEHEEEVGAETDEPPIDDEAQKAGEKMNMDDN